MLEHFKQLALNQYESAFCTLHECVVRCPQDMWQVPVGNNPFSQSVFHTLFYADLYLGQDIEEQKPQKFHKENHVIFDDYEQLDDRIPVATYEREFILKYLDYCRQKATDVLSSETEASLKSRTGFEWLETSRAEMHIYNIRHIQHHAAQCILRLRTRSGIDMPWIKSGWREF